MFSEGKGLSQDGPCPLRLATTELYPQPQGDPSGQQWTVQDPYFRYPPLPPILVSPQPRKIMPTILKSAELLQRRNHCGIFRPPLAIATNGADKGVRPMQVILCIRHDHSWIYVYQHRLNYFSENYHHRHVSCLCTHQAKFLWSMPIRRYRLAYQPGRVDQDPSGSFVFRA